jgi:hypothetical protein
MALMEGPRRPGAVLGLGYCDFEGYVVAVTAPGAPRLPNGVECDLEMALGAAAWIGEGRLESGGRSVLPGPAWEPVPVARYRLEFPSDFVPDPDLLAGRGSGLTPAGDDILAGYVAGLTLFQGRIAEARDLAATAASRTTSLSATLLRHAADGELPEPAHALLERGDPEPLRRFGQSSGRCLLLGLALACPPC